DTLKYRIPGESKKELKGRFEKRSSFNGFSGFVLTSFDKSRRFGFEESAIPNELHYSSSTPICDSKSEYIDKGKLLLEALQSERANKVILSRIHQSSYNSSTDQLFNELCTSYPDAFVYLVSSLSFGTWIGASPEVLLNCKEELFSTVALAGTKPAGKNVDWTSREKVEQQFVSEFIVSQLDDFQIVDLKTIGPKTVRVGPVEHLKTSFKFSFQSSDQVRLADTLHPTPAVCGSPRNAAMQIIDELETHDRSLYTGYIGLIGKKTALYVNLRCAQLIENDCYLYVGGGYTKDSVVLKEWVETENKAKTLLNVIEKL
ncbi:MAG: chorismate-binding protein, partial [Crocinitomicaceae bacterium]|nr:chorismate-binding protein [Crocinitomicaceae bacterium]